MTISRPSRRHVLGYGAAGAAALGMPSIARAQGQVVRIGLPTKTYYPTIIAETALRQKLFDKEGIKAELTIYRGGAEGYEAMAAGAADVIINSASSVAAGLQEGRDGEERRRRGARLLRLAPGGETNSKIKDPRNSTARRSASPRPAPAPTCWRAGRRRTARSSSRACRSAAAGWCRTCCGQHRCRGALFPADLQGVQEKQARSLIDFGAAVPPHLPARGSRPTSSSRKSRRSCRRR